MSVPVVENLVCGPGLHGSKSRRDGHFRFLNIKLSPKEFLTASLRRAITRNSLTRLASARLLEG
jgi:hypothetical protein